MTKRWQDKYERVRNVAGGGQGDALVARLRQGGEEVFIKILKHQNDLMRRKRMHREVEAYRTLEHAGIPVLVDSNSHQFDNLEFKLFLASRMVDGPTLTSYIEANGPMSLIEAQALVDRLLDIISYCHANGYVHRDVKPDNIILRDGLVSDAVLVDFGLSFDSSNESQQTDHGEELGNRFLRLPELSAGSEVKRDPRSDLTFVAGVFFYAITAKSPSTLADASGRMPHQREGARAILLESTTDQCLKRLLRLFDQAFHMYIDHRYQDAAMMRRDFSSITASSEFEVPFPDRIKQLKDRLGAGSVAFEKRVAEKLSRGLDLIQSAMASLQGQLGLSNSQTGYELNPSHGIAKNKLALMPNGRTVEEYVHFQVEVLGDELVFSAAYRDKVFQGFGRLPLSAPFNDPNLERTIQSIFLAQVENVLP